MHRELHLRYRYSPCRLRGGCARNKRLKGLHVDKVIRISVELGWCLALPGMSEDCREDSTHEVRAADEVQQQPTGFIRGIGYLGVKEARLIGGHDSSRTDRLGNFGWRDFPVVRLDVD